MHEEQVRLERVAGVLESEGEFAHIDFAQDAAGAMLGSSLSRSSKVNIFWRMAWPKFRVALLDGVKHGLARRFCPWH